MNKLTMILPFVVACASAQEACKPLPTFSLKATNGKTYTQRDFSAMPTVVIFLKKGCPHNPKSAPDFNKLPAMLGKKVNVVAITDADLATAKAYAKEIKLNVPLIADAKLSVINAFGAKRSLDMAITCTHDKKVAQMWEGYSQESLKELVASLPGHGGPSLNIKFDGFPTKKQSGCPFGM
jgi:peroxiredoxin